MPALVGLTRQTVSCAPSQFPRSGISQQWHFPAVPFPIPCCPHPERQTRVSNPKLVNEHTSAFFSAAITFLLATSAWNLANIWLLDVTVQERYTIGMGIMCSMFATVVVSKVVRDKEEARSLVNDIRQARYEEVLVNSPAPGLGHV